MLGFLRAYMYWTVLWGLIVHPSLGGREIAPYLLVAGDLMLLALTMSYVALNLGRLDDADCRRIVRLGLATLVIVAGFGAAVTVIHRGSLFEAAKYLGVLCRPVLILLALSVFVSLPGAPAPARLFGRLRTDLSILMGVQLVVATIQLASPSQGAEFIGAFNEHQSARWALEEGDVSGTFPNSIELAYFLLASYIALTLDAWRRLRPPSAFLTLLTAFFVYATGSTAATVCMGIYAGYLHARCLRVGARRLVYASVILATLALLPWTGGALLESTLAKVDNMMLSRLGLIFVSLPSLAVSSPAKLWSGFGADFGVILGALNSLPDTPLVFTYDDSAMVINDVFWVALVLSLGLPVTAIYVTITAQLFRSFLALGAVARAEQNLARIVLLLVLLAGFLNQILAVRSFVVPLLVGLLAIAVYARRRHPSQARP